MQKLKSPFKQEETKWFPNAETIELETYDIITFNDLPPGENLKRFEYIHTKKALCIVDTKDAETLCDFIAERQKDTINAMPFVNSSTFMDNYRSNSKFRPPRSTFLGPPFMIPSMFTSVLQSFTREEDTFVHKTEAYFKQFVEQHKRVWKSLSSLKKSTWLLSDKVAKAEHMIMVNQISHLFQQVHNLATMSYSAWHAQLMNPHPYMIHYMMANVTDTPLPLHAQYDGCLTKVKPVVEGMEVTIYFPKKENYINTNVSTFHTEKNCISTEDIYIKDPRTGKQEVFPSGTNITTIIEILHPGMEYPETNYVAEFQGKYVYLNPTCTYSMCAQDRDRAYVTPFEHLLMPYSFQCTYSESKTIASDNGFSIVSPNPISYNLYSCLMEEPFILDADAGMLSINTGPMSNEICDNGQPVFFLPNSTNVFQRMKNKQREAVPAFHDVVDLDETKAKFVAALIAQIFPKQTFISDPPFQHITINLKTPNDGGNGTSSSYNKLGRLPTVRKFLLNAGNSIVDTMSKAGSTVTSTFNTIVGLPGQILSAAMSVFYALIALGALYAII